MNYFKERAAEPDARFVETQINAVLREFIESGEETYSRLLDDERFIGAVARRVKDRLVETE